MAVDSRPTVLVVDDESAIRKLVRAVLENEQCRVIEASHGGDGLRLVESEEIDVLVSDVRMPVMSGKRLGVAARQMRPALKILYLTGHVDLLFEDRDLLGQYEAFLEKPFTGRGLAEAVSLLLQTDQPLAAN
jgi:two-component system, cell cycle sensor histidine kinase and response regulator CckA